MNTAVETAFIATESNAAVNITPEIVIAVDPDETQLTAEVECLWAEHRRVNSLKKTSTADCAVSGRNWVKSCTTSRKRSPGPVHNREWSGHRSLVEYCVALAKPRKLEIEL